MTTSDAQHKRHYTKFSRSSEIFRAAQRVTPGGVNSPVRAYKSVGGEPIVVARGEGSRIWDVDGNEYIDYVGSWGPLILGHAPGAVVEAVCRAAADGTSFGALTEREVDLRHHMVTREEYNKYMQGEKLSNVNRYRDYRRVRESEESKCPFGFGKKT